MSEGDGEEGTVVREGDGGASRGRTAARCRWEEGRSGACEAETIPQQDERTLMTLLLLTIMMTMTLLT